MRNQRFVPGLGILCLAASFILLVQLPARAQDLPPQRQIRSFVPPDQLVSFRPETPFNQFIDFLNPIFQRVTGKQVIDPETRTQAIGISIAGMHFFDALELVLQINDLTYRETDRFFMVEPLPPDQPLTSVPDVAGTLQESAALHASLDSREIQINATLFAVNLTKARDTGIDWNVFFCGETAGGSGGQGQTGTTGGETNTGVNFFLDTRDLANAIDDVLIIPNQINMREVTQFFRLLEREGLGETIANPRVTVQSGEQGRIQVGTDFPFVTRDFSGNTITQFVSTGIIVEVTPTLITQPVVDTTGAPLLDFIHLNVRVENSAGQVSPAGPIVDRNTATTQVLLLNGEQTIIGGLYSTEDQVNRRGIPLLKDLPGWFFGIRYLAGVTQRTQIQRELLILLEARLVDPLRARANRPFDEDLLEQRRRQIEETIRRALGAGAVEEIKFQKSFQENEQNR